MTKNSEFDIIIIASSIVDYKNELKLAKEIKKKSNAKICIANEGSFEKSTNSI